MREVAPYAVYIHCYAHFLNLALVDCVKTVQSSFDFFCLLESLYVFMSTTKAHCIFEAKQKELHPGKQIRRLQRLSDTRWACRQSAVNAVCYTYDSSIATLKEISDGPDRAKAVEACGLLLQISKFKFLLTLIIFDKVLTYTKSLSDCLQGTQVNLGKAGDLVTATVSTLVSLRTDEEWDKVYAYAERVAEVNEIDFNPLPPRARQLPLNLRGDIITVSTTGSREILSTKDNCKVNLYYPVIDSFLAELNQRFSEKNIDFMKSISSLNPDSKSFLN